MFHVKHMNQIIKKLYQLALKSYRHQEMPVGAIVLYKDKIVGVGCNNRQKKHNVCGHAEINAIIQAEKKLKDWRLNECVLISNLEPCRMCTKVIMEARIKQVFYIIPSNNTKHEKCFKQIYFPGNNLICKMEQLIIDFFKKIR